MCRKLPIGIQSFEDIRKNEYMYIDKTEYIYKLVHEGKPYFLSRPRRFGKSLFLSALCAYFEGKKDLFAGLKITELEKDNPGAWVPYPVFYFDFNQKNFRKDFALEEVLDAHLSEWENKYGNEYSDKPLEERFGRLIVKAVEKYGRNAVVLVDEYDKSLLEAGNPERLEHNRAVFKGFFSTLKSYDEYLKFVFITGVTKFSKVSIFSDLNQLIDISLNPAYSGICGITEKEIRDNLDPEVQELAVANDLTAEDCYAKLKKMYDGYCFSEDSEGVYNPFSLLNALYGKRFKMYWFSTGTPTFLIDKLKISGFDPKVITGGELYADENVLTDYIYDSPDPVPVFYQTGYLTIRGYDRRYRSYQLGYPNDEVKYGFLDCLAPMFLHQEDTLNPLDVRSFGMDIEKGNTDGLRDRLTALFARLPYPDDEKVLEQNFQNVIYIVFMLMGQFVHTEIHSAKGRADVIVEADDYVYIFEFKRDKSAEEALKQIDDMGYTVPYKADKRTVYKIGVDFSSSERTIDGWIAEKM